MTGLSKKITLKEDGRTMEFGIRVNLEAFSRFESKTYYLYIVHVIAVHKSAEVMYASTVS